MNYQLELRHLRYFQVLGQELHFRKTAEKLYISQPALSKQIQQLESILGLQLFDRHNRKVELTTAGKYFHQEVQLIMQSMQQSIAHTQMLAKGLEGRLRMGYLGSAMQSIIPDFLNKIRRTMPNMNFDLKEMENHEQIDSLLKGEIDLGFVRLDRAPRGLEMRSIFEESFSVVLPLQHPINRDNFESLYQLKDESFILFDPNYSQSYYNKVMQIFDQSGFTPIISHNTIHAVTIYRLVENNFGVSIVPTSLQKGFDLKIKFIELKNINISTTLQVIWKKNQSNPMIANVKELLDIKPIS